MKPIYSKTKAKAAMLAAAAHIEAHPEQYRFSLVSIPDPGEADCAACMWGWTGYYLGIAAGRSISDAAEAVGKKDSDLYLSAWTDRFRVAMRPEFSQYYWDARQAAALLREFAETAL